MQARARQATASGGAPPLRVLCISPFLGEVPGDWLLSGAKWIRLDETFGFAVR